MWFLGCDWKQLLAQGDGCFLPLCVPRVLSSWWERLFWSGWGSVLASEILGDFLEFILAASLEICVENSVWPAGAGKGLSHLEGWGISVQERH